MSSMTLHETTPLSLSLTHRIPPEVYDKIIDNLHSFKPDLSACSLVCKAWLPTCRYHLFFDVNLSPELVNFLRSSSHAMETITPYIRNAGLGGAWSMTQRDEFDNVISLLLNLENIHGISLETWSWSFLSSKSQSLLLKAEGIFFQNITTVYLKYIKFPSFPLLAAFIGGFSSLMDLSFDNVTWDLAGYSLISMLTALEDRNRSLRPSRLHTLKIQSCPVKPVLYWLFGDDLNELEDTSKPALHFLAIPEVLPSEISIVGSVLRGLGSSLHRLEVGFLAHNIDDADIGVLLRMINLSYNTNLRHLHVHQVILYQFPPYKLASATDSLTKDHTASPSSPYAWLIPLLSGLSSESFEELAFTMWLGTEYGLDLVDWPAMTDVLSMPVFTDIQNIKFWFLGMGQGRDNVRSWLLARLKGWGPVERALDVQFLDE